MDVKAELTQQFAASLDEVNGLSDAGERETVRLIREAIGQVLDTFDSEQGVRVSASGHMGFLDWDSKAGSYQNVSLSITPVTLAACQA